MARHYHRDPAPDAGRTFDPRSDPSTPRAWLVTFAIVAAMAAFGAIGAHCSQPAPIAVQP